LRGLDPDELKEKGDALLVTGKGKGNRRTLDPISPTKLRVLRVGGCGVRGSRVGPGDLESPLRNPPRVELVAAAEDQNLQLKHRVPWIQIAQGLEKLPLR